MLRELLSNRLFIGALAFFILCVVGGTLYIAHVERQGIEDVAPETEEPAAPLAEKPKPPPPGESAESGHWHGDEWHSEPHETPDTSAASAGQSYIPEGVAVTPDFPPVGPNADPVEEAYKRLEYIKNNLYAWGGVHSERATELIAVLLPPQMSRDHDHGDEVHDYLVELIAQNDPRTGEVIIANICEGSVGGNMLTDALVEIGPPAVPYILPYFEKGVAEGGRIRRAVFTSLGRIGARYRDDLGGILDHIIIPKLEVIAADENTERYDWASVLDAREALAYLGR